MISRCWYNKIVSGEKTLEIRHFPIMSLVGERVYLCVSGSFAVTASCVIESSEGPLSLARWAELRQDHCVQGPPRYKSSYAWKLCDVKLLKRPIPICRNKGSIGLQKGPGKKVS